VDNNGPVPYQLSACGTMTVGGAVAKQAGCTISHGGAGIWNILLNAGITLGNYLVAVTLTNVALSAGAGYGWTDGDATHKFLTVGVGGVAADLAVSFALFLPFI
jgi:hypothetical protein